MYDDRTKKLMTLALNASGAKHPDRLDDYIQENKISVRDGRNRRRYVVYKGLSYGDGADVAVDLESGSVIVDTNVISDLVGD